MTVSANAMRLALFFGIVLALFVGYYTLSTMGAANFIEDGTALKQWIQHLGLIGPLAIIALMTTAIVMSPIPSAPIALAAGAVYGHTAGTVYVAIGSELGAIIAFFIARLVGVATVQKWIGDQLIKGKVDSQNTLMSIVFFSRLLPFVSFDIISYAAGVTPLRFWRFALATFAGIIPASFLLAHFGSELATGESQRVTITLFLLSGLSLIIILFRRLSAKRKT